MSCPSKKVTFSTLPSAWEAAIGLSRKHLHKLVPYRCWWCKKYHLTKRADTVKNHSLIPYKVALKLQKNPNGKLKAKKKQKIYTPMPKPEKPSVLKEIPEWKKKILRFIIKILGIK